MSTEISEYDSSIAAAQQQLGRLEEEKLTLNKTTDALRAQIQAADKNKMSYRFTSRISSMMDNLITDVVRGKFQQIEQLTLQMFHKITHKDNFVDLMELDDSFNISMYKAQRYTMGELYALLEHIGPDELQARLGNTGMQILLAWFNISSPRMLRKTMKNAELLKKRIRVNTWKRFAQFALYLFILFRRILFGLDGLDDIVGNKTI